MSITTYAELQTAAANWLKRSDLTSYIPDLIRLGELRIFREVRCRIMESSLSSAISSGVVTVPSDYLGLKSAYIDGSPTQKLQRATVSQIYDKYPLRAAEGKPKMVAREGSSFIFGPYPDSSYTMKGIYYAKPTSIQTSANALFLESPDLYLFAALAEAAPFLKDDARIVIWDGKYASVVKQIEDADRDEDSTGGGLAVVVA